jgi:methylglutaconyl-CoA hydratase
MAELAILVDDSDPTTTILTLNRPEKRNALSILLLEQLIEAVEYAAQDRKRRVLIIRGAGPTFCAGLDLKEASDPAKSHQSAETLAKMYHAVATSPLVTIAAAHGVAMGGGSGLISACDFVVATDDFKLSYPEVHRGLIAALVTTLLRRQLGDRQVRELTILGQTITGQKALELGVLNRVVPHPQLMETCVELARQVCLGAPGAIARTKKLLDLTAPRSVREELDRALAFHLEARESSEAKEGVAAFLEKRRPNWGDRPD